MSNKIIYDATKPFEFIDDENNLRTAYYPQIDMDDISEEL